MTTERTRIGLRHVTVVPATYEMGTESDDPEASTDGESDDGRTPYE